MPIRVVLVDDHGMVRQGLRMLLDGYRDITVVGEESDGARAVATITRLRPDVAVLDLMLPGLGGVEVARELARREAAPKVVMLSMFGTESYVAEALRAGACGYVVKDATSRDLVAAIRAAAAGRRYLSPSIDEAAIDRYLMRRTSASLDPLDTLTERERQVFRLTAAGRTSAQIGLELSISPRTAEVHRTNVMRKLGLGGQADLIRYAIQRGVLPPQIP